MLAAIRAAGVADAQYQPDQFTIAVRRDSPDESPTHIYLGNLYSECDGVEPDERDERVAAFVAAVLDVSETPDTWDEAWPLLRPLMRPTTHHLAVADTIEHVRRPAWPFVSEYIVVDLPTKMAFVTTKDLDQWGVPEALVFDQAHHNMSGSAQATAADLTAESKQLIRLVDDGNAYWASHLFVDGWLAAVAPEDGGRPLFFVPDTTGALLVGTSPMTGPTTWPRSSSSSSPSTARPRARSRRLPTPSTTPARWCRSPSRPGTRCTRSRTGRRCCWPRRSTPRRPSTWSSSNSTTRSGATI
ncbi:DUF1444 domain-containing protein [Dactylosporangium cerinum]